jgi:formimidoylglutamate deiminase
VHIHVAEQPAEVAECVEHLSARPVAWLLDHAEVDAAWCLVHATHLDDTERRRAAATGALAGVCPTTEADLGDGFFDAEGWFGAGGKLGVGSDSHLRLDPGEELRLLEFSERLRQGRRDVLADENAGPGTRLWRQAALDGSQALAQPVGAIGEGYRADLVELDPAHPLIEACPAGDLLELFVLAGGPAMIRSVRVAGEAVVEHGRHRAQAPLREAFRGAQAFLWGGA